MNKKVHFDDIFYTERNRIITKVSLRDGDRIFEIGTVFPTGKTPGGLNIKDYKGKHINVEVFNDIYEIKGIMAAD